MKKRKFSKIRAVSASLLLVTLLASCNTGSGNGAETTLGATDAQTPSVTQPQTPTAPVDKTMKKGVVCEIKGGDYRYQAWPSVCVDENGVLYAVSSGYRTGHIDPFGRNVMYISKDGGLTWSNPVIINDTLMDDRDAGILYLGNGKMLVSFFYNAPSSMYKQYESGASEAVQDVLDDWKALPEEQQKTGGSYVILSDDYGLNWGEPIRVPISAPHGPQLLSNGKLLYIGNPHFANGDSSTGYEARIEAWESVDGGKTWTKVGRIPCQKRAFEPHVVELPDGSLLAALRVDDDDSAADMHTIYLSRSTNGGKSWTVAKPTNWDGFPPHLMVHSSGALIVTYGVRRAPCGTRARVSYDNGNTWSDEIILNDDAPHGDCGYPCSAELPDGSIVTVYYQAIKQGDPCSILYTKWWVEKEMPK